MTEWAGESVCCAHFGLSLLVTVYANGRRHRVLFDAGPESYAMLQAIVPCHCTGWRAVTAQVTAFGEAVVMPAAVGKVYTF